MVFICLLVSWGSSFRFLFDEEEEDDEGEEEESIFIFVLTFFIDWLNVESREAKF